MPGYIYGLSDPRTKKIRYVGQTVNLDNRYKQHCEKMDKTPKSNWVNELKKNRLLPSLTILEHVDDSSDLSYKEKWWISIGRKIGWDLLNVADPTREEAKFDDLFSQSLKTIFQEYHNEHSPLASINRSQSRYIGMAAYALLLGFLEYRFWFTATSLNNENVAILLALMWILVTYAASMMGMWAALFFDRKKAALFPLIITLCVLFILLT